jgi:hypothetical protein
MYLIALLDLFVILFLYIQNQYRFIPKEVAETSQIFLRDAQYTNMT